MIYRTFGRTGLKVSVAGLGSGGASRLGLSRGKSEAEVIALIHLALDLGVNLIDTAAAYGTEGVIGKALQSVPRDRVVITTKARPPRPPTWVPPTPEAVAAGLDNSLRELRTDHIDVFQLHMVAPQIYDHARDRLYPVLQRAREQGKIRFIGMTETAPYDLEHAAFHRALEEDDLWDSLMVSFNMTHQNARTEVFPGTMKKRVGTLLMFAVRGLFARPAELKARIAALALEGLLPDWLGRAEDPLGFLVHDGGARSVTDAAYRFVRDEPGVDVVLFGTSDEQHLRDNVASLTGPPLPEADRQRLVELFGHLVGVGIDEAKLTKSA